MSILNQPTLLFAVLGAGFAAMNLLTPVLLDKARINHNKEIAKATASGNKPLVKRLERSLEDLPNYRGILMAIALCYTAAEIVRNFNPDEDPKIIT
jgi:multidrug efflux pump subunit AcrB